MIYAQCVLIHLSRIYKIKIQNEWITSEIPKKTRDILGKTEYTYYVKCTELRIALKEETGSKNFDDAIRKLSEKRVRVPKSMFGAHPEMTSFTEKDKIRLHEL